jgi:hypothetical protein
VFPKRVAGDYRTARGTHVISFSVKYYDRLAFKRFTIETKYTDFTGEEYVEFSIRHMRHFVSVWGGGGADFSV